MKAIVAVDQNWGIGYQGKLLAHIPEDLNYFKSKTLGKVIVMGRETLETLPGGKPLPGRTNIVLTGNASYEASCSICCSMEAALELIKTYNDKDVLIIGGEQIYRQFLPFCDEVYVTKIEATFICDKHFPNPDKMDDWKQSEEPRAGEHNGLKYQFTKYLRRME